jgi:3-methylfumaryl-CoA hydratase
VHPVFDSDPFFVCGEPQADGRTFRLWVKDHEGFLTMDATAVIANGSFPK